MVDLVKIRKKAKEQKERDAASAAGRSADQMHSLELEPVPSAADRLERFKLALIAGTAAAEHHDPDSDESAESRGELEVLTFTIGTEEYAVPIESVVEIVTPGEIIRVPNAPTNISGIISLRGTIVTILDVGGKLGHEPAARDLETRIVVVRDAAGSAGFVVDKVLRVVKVPAGELDTEPVSSPEARSDMIKGVFRRNGGLSILLEIERLVGDDASHDPDL